MSKKVSSHALRLVATGGVGLLAGLMVHGSASAQSMGGYGGGSGGGGGGLSKLGIADPSLRQLMITGDLRAEYDSNVAKGNQNLANSRRLLHLDDYVYTPNVSLVGNLPIGRQAIFINADYNYQFHQYNRILDHSRVNVTGGGIGRFGRCETLLTVAYSERLSDLTDVPAETVKSVRRELDEMGQVSCVAGSGIGGTVGVTHSKLTNSGSTGLDSETWGANGSLTYANQLLGTAALIGSYSHLDYDNSVIDTPVTSPVSSQGYEIISGGVQLDRPIGARLNGSAGLQYFSLQPRGAGIAGLNGISGEANLAYKVSYRLEADLSYSRQVKPSVQVGNSYSLDNLFQATAVYTISPRIHANLGGSILDKDFGTAAVQRLIVPTHEHLTRIMTGVALKVGKKSSVALDARREVMTTNLPEFNYTAYVVGLNLSTAF